MRRFHPARSLAVISIVAVVASAPGLPAQNPSPPTAKVIARIDTLHGDVRTDNYFWLREKTNPEVITAGFLFCRAIRVCTRKAITSKNGSRDSRSLESR